MKRLFVVGCIAALVGVNVVGQSQSADQAKIQGVWRLVEETRPAQKQPATPYSASLWIFTGKHHALVGEFFREKPRPNIPAAPANVTLDDLRDAYDGIYARAGTYEIEPGNVFIERNFAAKGAATISYQLPASSFGTGSWKLGAGSWDALPLRANMAMMVMLEASCEVRISPI